MDPGDRAAEGAAVLILVEGAGCWGEWPFLPDALAAVEEPIVEGQTGSREKASGLTLNFLFTIQ